MTDAYHDYQTATDGWVCTNCGAHVPWGTTHSCGGSTLPPQAPQFTYQIIQAPWDEILALLERIAAALEYSSGYDLLSPLEKVLKLAAEDCTCTEEQQSGDDPTLCPSCEACGELNRLGEMRDEMVRDLTERLGLE